MIKLRQKSMLSYFIQPFFTLFLLAGIFGIIWLRSGIISMEYAISELENKKLESLKDAKSLLAERASAVSMQRMEKVAARDLGLVLADRTMVVYVKAGVTGPSRASLEETRGGSNGGVDVPEGSVVRSEKLVSGAGMAGDSYNGGYQ